MTWTATETSTPVKDDAPAYPPLTTPYLRLLGFLFSHPQMGHEKIARELGSTMRTVQRHLDELKAAGAVTVDSTLRPHRYALNLDWRDADGIRLRDLIKMAA